MRITILLVWLIAQFTFGVNGQIRYRRPGQKTTTTTTETTESTDISNGTQLTPTIPITIVDEDIGLLKLVIKPLKGQYDILTTNGTDGIEIVITEKNEKAEVAENPINQQEVDNSIISANVTNVTTEATSETNVTDISQTNIIPETSETTLTTLIVDGSEEPDGYDGKPIEQEGFGNATMLGNTANGSLTESTVSNNYVNETSTTDGNLDADTTALVKGMVTKSTNLGHYKIDTEPDA